MKSITYFFAIVSTVLFLGQISFLKFNIGYGYYGILALILFVYLFIGKTQLNLLMVWLILAGFLSIFFNKIPEFFKPYERLVALIILVGVIGPLILNSPLSKFRFLLFRNVKILLVSLTAVSFLGILIGVSWMYGRGGFAGLFNHSMMLGPMAAIALLISLDWGFRESNKKIRFSFYGLAGISFITCVASGSRSALLAGICGVLYFLYKTNKNQLFSFIKIVCLIGFLGSISFPLWSDFTGRIIDKMEYANENDNLFVTREFLWESRILEFERSPVYGIGFGSVDTTLNDKFNKEEGTIEPGSSWLVVLSMVGLLGFIPLIILILKLFVFIHKNENLQSDLALLGALLTFYLVHMFAEGYIFSAGSGLFFMFWLTLGIIYQLKKQQISSSTY
ncbi:hypothetical protein E0K83_02195 [Gramella sp. BOM4]|nr:hypothetical protein [Christiangramia bathymodioli]